MINAYKMDIIVDSASENAVILSHRVKVAGQEGLLILTSKELKLSIKSKETNIINWPDVVGIKTSEAETFSLHYIHHGSKHKLHLKTLQIKDCSIACINAINNQMKASGQPKKLFVVINPIGGGGKGLQIYRRTVEPLFKLADIETTVVVTEKSKHALQIGEDTDFAQYDGIVVVGGDGLYQEILQGLTLQEQKKSGLNYDNPEHDLRILDKPIGIIPAGTGNAITKLLNGTIDAKIAALNIIRGEYRRAEVFAVYNNNKLFCVSGLLVACGMFSDLIKRTEELRWMKKIRYPYAILGMLFKRKRMFEGELQYCLQNEDSGEASEGASTSWTTHGNSSQRYGCIYALPWELIDKGDYNIVDPCGQKMQLVACTNGSMFTALKTLGYITFGKKVSSKTGSIEWIENVKKFKIKMLSKNLDSDDSLTEAERRATELDSYLDVDGELLRLETPEALVKLQTSFVPLFGRKLSDL